MSLKEIAEKSGVSISTVSRVLSGKNPKCASVAVQDRIRDIASQMDYVPDRNACALKAGGEKTKPVHRVSVVVFRIPSLQDDPFFMELYRHLERELFAWGCTVRLVMRPSEADIRALASVDGVILLGRCAPEELRLVRAANRNMIGIWRNPMEEKIDQIYCSGEVAASKATEYLLGLGHKSIAYIGNCSAEGRFLGYTRALLDHGIPIRLPLVFEVEQSAAAGENAMRKILENGSATAVLCANDNTAIGALGALCGTGGRKTVPVSVISIDNIEASAWTKPMLTTMSIPQQDMAHLGAGILIDRIRKGHSEFVQVELPPRLIERESCFVQTDNPGK